MSNQGLQEKLVTSAKITDESRQSVEDLHDKTGDVSHSENSSNNLRASHLSSSSPRRSILKVREGKKGSDKRISFHENLKEVHEVESWKKYNVAKRGCCQCCREECTLI